MPDRIMDKLLDFKKPAYNTDNKINRFVTFFALDFNHLDSFVLQDKPGSRTCFL